jgi:hypothetical protein
MMKLTSPSLHIQTTMPRIELTLLKPYSIAILSDNLKRIPEHHEIIYPLKSVQMMS